MANHSNAEQDGEGLLDARQVGRLLGVSADWVYAATRRGELPFYAVGKSRRFRRSEIESWLSSQRGGPA